MVAYNFMGKFAAAIKAGRKTQTIRRNLRCKPGDALQLYTGQRTPACQKIADAVCLETYPLTISDTGIRFEAGQCHSLRHPHDLDSFAQADGFIAWEDMKAFFFEKYGLPFKGFLIKWELKK